MRKKKFRFKPSLGDRLFDLLVHGFLMLSLLLILYPLLYIVSASFSAPSAIVSGAVWLFPVQPTLLGYSAVFKNAGILTGYANSFLYAVLGTLVNLVVTMLAAYPLSRKDFFGRNLFMGLFVFTMLFSGGLIPLYLVVFKLGIINTVWSMILPGAMSVWNVILVRTYLQNTIPEELYEAANIDGSSKYRMLSMIVVPLSGPILAVIALYCAVGAWNSYFDALIYLSSKELFPLQIILRNILIINKIDASMVADVSEIARKQGMVNVLKFSLIVVASVPLILAYPFVQRFFVKGVMVGSIKG